MTKFKIKASAEEAAKAGQDQGDFEVPKPGFYHLRIVEANAGFSKTDGEEDQDKPRIEVIYEVVGEGMESAPVDKNYGRIWDYITFGDGYAATRRVEFTKALYPDVTDEDIVAGNVELDTDELVERIVVARLKQEVDKQKTEEARAADKKAPRVFRARVALLLSPDNLDGYTEVEHGADAYGSANGGDEPDPFADAEGQPSSEEDLLTEEELQAMDMKELGATAKEFDLNPEDSIVKVRGKVNLEKSKEKIIAAILEAQGAEEEPGDGGGDDSPF